MSVDKHIKHMLVEQHKTLKYVADVLGETNPSKYLQQSLSKRINAQTIQFREVEQIADILGYEIKFVPKNPEK